MMKRGAPHGEISVWETGHHPRFHDATMGDDEYPPLWRNGIQGLHPCLPLVSAHARRGTAADDQLGEAHEGLRPRPALMMTDLVEHIRGNVA